MQLWQATFCVLQQYLRSLNKPTLPGSTSPKTEGIEFIRTWQPHLHIPRLFGSFQHNYMRFPNKTERKMLSIGQELLRTSLYWIQQKEIAEHPLSNKGGNELETSWGDRSSGQRWKSLCGIASVCDVLPLSAS